MYKLIATALVLISLVGCKGPITGHNYTQKEIMQMSSFLAVSQERLKAYKNGNITIEELGVSADRMRQAIEYAQKRKVLPQ